MNSQMKELLDWAKDHAGIYVIECELANIPFDQEEYDRRFQEKFAELIVRECVGIVEGIPPGYRDYRDQIEDAFRRDCMEEIKQHFGVEE
jgi:hypothetical protein